MPICKFVLGLVISVHVVERPALCCPALPLSRPSMPLLVRPCDSTVWWVSTILAPGPPDVTPESTQSTSFAQQARTLQARGT